MITNNKPKHTPGPLIAAQTDDADGSIIIETADGRLVARVCQDGVDADAAEGWMPAEEGRANADLFAAAPDLLAAMRDLCAAASSYRPGRRSAPEVDGPMLDSAITGAYAAIAKAEGRGD